MIVLATSLVIAQDSEDSVRALVRVDDHAPIAVPTRGHRAAQDLDRAASQEAVREAALVPVTRTAVAHLIAREIVAAEVMVRTSPKVHASEVDVTAAEAEVAVAMTAPRSEIVNVNDPTAGVLAVTVIALNRSASATDLEVEVQVLRDLRREVVAIALAAVVAIVLVVVVAARVAEEAENVIARTVVVEATAVIGDDDEEVTAVRETEVLSERDPVAEVAATAVTEEAVGSLEEHLIRKSLGRTRITKDREAAAVLHQPRKTTRAKRKITTRTKTRRRETVKKGWRTATRRRLTIAALRSNARRSKKPPTATQDTRMKLMMTNRRSKLRRSWKWKRRRKQLLLIAKKRLKKVEMTSRPMTQARVLRDRRIPTEEVFLL